ncbi:F-box/FBD/LRR-repeat protein At1g16930-like [Cornus florida]|uniref:F-box/FBD/LRR-repeat protein At1g16930-like n=1 Tax=Cornus florida TaxID=4283 RepID=UPI00289D5B1B|nr:F-box/FBD/LRR-repeat protein At1g16930-like [Cornus florida]
MADRRTVGSLKFCTLLQLGRERDDVEGLKLPDLGWFSDGAHEKAGKGGTCLEDRISELPDVVLVSILSLLTMKEAGRTSVLSKRWRYMWTHITALNFDAAHIIDGIRVGDKQLEEERPSYLSWVNQVLKTYNGPSLDEFRVQFDLDETCRFDIDNWINFALEKRVKSLDLDFLDTYRYTRKEGDYIYRITNHPHGFTSCNFLTNLQLNYVNVTGQVLEYFLINCPFLEQLFVHDSIGLVNLKVPELSLKLKRLAITYCINVESIEISAMNLMSFHYLGPRIILPFKNVPMPVDLYIGGLYAIYLIYNFMEISSYLSQLESLTLDLISLEHDIKFAQFPILNNLKQLELRVNASDDESLLVFAPLIEACPFLSKFVLKLHWRKAGQKRKHHKFTSRTHQYLKVVEFIGFVGRTNDVELAMYLIKSAIKLEKITFDPRDPLAIGTPWEFTEFAQPKREKAARKFAKKLGTKLPVGADLVIL